MDVTRFYGVVVVLSGDVVNSIFRITLVVFFKVLPRYQCGVLEMVIEISPYQPLTKAIFSSLEICGNILNIFWGRIKTTKFMYKIY